MSITIQTPNITAANDRERLQQMQSYLYQMAQQLQWAFNTIETGSTGVVPTSLPRTAGTGGNGAPENPKATFASIKDLIIKSADIVEAYYDTISSRLEGLYVAQSDFGIYTEQTTQEIQGNSTSINQLFTNEQTIYTRLDGLDTENQVQNDKTESLTSGLAGVSDSVAGLAAETKEIGNTVDSLYAQSLQTNAYLKSGLLYYKDDGTPVYGLEIGQTNSVDGSPIFDKFARFAADRLSFFDSNDVEVAYISDYKLYITNAEITGSLWLSGKFKIYYNGGLAFQWIGGDS